MKHFAYKTVIVGAGGLYGAKLTMIMRLERAGAATMVARQASVGVKRELSTTETASYSLMTARTVGVSDSQPFQLAAIRVTVVPWDNIQIRLSGYL
eukprot:3443467-Pleurochrysis_carterae.AAC.1